MSHKAALGGAAMGSAGRLPKGAGGIVVVTSWDDGHETDLQVADWLGEYGLKGTFFLTTHAFGQPDCGVKVMSETQVQTLARVPHVEVGGHTHEHRRIECLSPRARLETLSRCRNTLEDLTGTEIASFAYPFGDCPDDRQLDGCAAELSAAGFQSGRLMRRSEERAGALALCDVPELRYRLPITGEIEDLSEEAIRSTAAAARERSDYLVLHFVGHSGRMARERGAKVREAVRATLRALGEWFGEGHDDVWSCTQGELVELAERQGT